MEAPFDGLLTANSAESNPVKALAFVPGKKNVDLCYEISLTLKNLSKVSVCSPFHP